MNQPVKDGGAGSKRKVAPDSTVSSPFAVAEQTDSTDDVSDRTNKKPTPVASSTTAVKPEEPPSDATSDVKAEVTSSSCTSTSATDGPTDELILEWEDGDGERFPIDEVIAQGKGLGETSAAEQNDTRENGEQVFYLKLMEKKKDQKSKELAKLTLYWWADSSHANLMNFNQLSQDLANFSFELWCAAGRNHNQYNDMAIEFGESRYSGVEVNELIADALDSGDYATPEAAYLDISRHGQACQTKEHGLRLINGLLGLIGQTSTLITHGSDLEKLNIGYNEREHLRLEVIEGRSRNQWYVRPADMDG